MTHLPVHSRLSPQPVPQDQWVPLDRLAQGAGGLIEKLDLAPQDLQRLEVMGICPGRYVRVVKPGNPLIIRVLGTRIGLASLLASFVLVSPCNPHTENE